MSCEVTAARDLCCGSTASMRDGEGERERERERERDARAHTHTHTHTRCSLTLPPFLPYPDPPPSLLSLPCGPSPLSLRTSLTASGPPTRSCWTRAPTPGCRAAPWPGRLRSPSPSLGSSSFPSSSESVRQAIPSLPPTCRTRGRREEEEDGAGKREDAEQEHSD